MNNLANVFGLISHFFWRKTDHIILRGSQFLRVGNSQLKDDKLGIGTTSPAYDLHLYDADETCWIEVEAGLAGVNTGIAFKNPSQRWLIYNDGASGNRLRIRNATGTANVFTVLTSNKVGIMTNDPDAMLHVAGRMRSESGMGWRHTKSCANNTATNIATLTMPTPHLLMTALVTLSVSASGKRAIQSYIVSWVYNKVDVTAMGSPTFTGVTTLTLTAAATTGSKLLTLTALQNSGAEETVEINVQPIAVHAEEVATFAGL